MIEGNQLTDHAEAGVRDAELVGWRARQLLHLPHDVIAEVAHDAAVERWKASATRHRGAHQQVLERFEHATGTGLRVDLKDRDTRPSVLQGRDAPSAGGKDEQGAPTHEGVAAPALATLDRLEQEPLIVADGPHEHADRRQGVGNELHRDRHDAVLGRLHQEPWQVRTTGVLHRRHDPDPSPGPLAIVR